MLIPKTPDMLVRLRLNIFILVLSAIGLCLAPQRAWAVTYYVSNSGNDANSGTSPAQAWQTLDRLEQIQYSMQPGDQVLLQRGGIFRGALPLNSFGSASAPIVVGAYGSGEDPIVSGSKLVTNWTPYQGNIWKAPIAAAVKQVYVNGNFMTLARYPNTGWLRMDQGTDTTIDDADLTNADGYWTGATAVIRATHYGYTLAQISNSTNGVLTFPSTQTNPGNYQWGYFLCNKLSELDAPGEWYFDPQAGMLYLQAPNNADPNSLDVEATVLDSGAYIGWQRAYINIQDITFQHQNFAGIEIDGGRHINVTGCTFRNVYHGIRSYGFNNSYTNCTISNTLGTGAVLVDSSSTFSWNQLDSIAMIPGSGESGWGYFGVNVLGGGCTVSHNRLEHVGYIGISCYDNTLVERNLVQNAVAILDDGSGIGFDKTDGAIIRDNIITDITGDIESTAPDEPNYVHTAFGIYFGNNWIKNTVVQRNTITRCASAGMHVDHSMGNTGNSIVDNVLYDNGTQMSISDWSNNAGPYAVPPYYVPSFNEVYSGNILYSITKDQLCMRQLNTHSTGPVDFGMFSNNKYYNPYNELSIYLYNTYSGFRQAYTLEQWQEHTNDDAGSSSSPLHLNDMVATSTIGDELVDNGTFTNDVNGWSGWPSNGEVTHDLTHLDNGSLKANLPDASMYPEFTFRNPLAFPVVSGAWYRMGFSVQSDIQGQLVAAVKGLSQVAGLNTVGRRIYPFSSGRRDVEFFFQSALTDQALVQFTNDHLFPHYWLDNVSVQQVQVEAVDPNDKQVLLYNDQETEQSFPLEGCWSDLNGNYHTGSITLQSFGSIVLVKESEDLCDNFPTGIPEGRVSDPAAIYPNPVHPGGLLHFRNDMAGSFQVWGMNGQLILGSPLTPGASTVRVPVDLAPGVYVALIKGSGAEQHIKLVIQ